MAAIFRSADSAYSGAGTTVAVTKPAGTIQGDLLIGVFITRGGTNVTHTLPANWQQITQEDHGTVLKLTTGYLVAGPSEGASYTFTVSTAQRATAGIHCYRGVDNASPIGNSADGQGTSTNPVAPSITTTATKAMVVAFAGNDENHTSTPPAGMSERFDEQGTGASGYGADAIQAAPGATGTKTFGVGNNTNWCAATVELLPARRIFVTQA